MFCDTTRSIIGEGAAVELATGRVVVEELEVVKAVVAVAASRPASDEHPPATMLAIVTARTTRPRRIMVTGSHSRLMVQSL
jgi:hypothetical protein